MRFVSLSPRAFFRRRRRCCRRHHRGISKYISNAYKFDRANAHSLTKEMITIINGLTSSSSSKKKGKTCKWKKMCVWNCCSIWNHVLYYFDRFFPCSPVCYILFTRAIIHLYGDVSSHFLLVFPYYLFIHICTLILLSIPTVIVKLIYFFDVRSIKTCALWHTCILLDSSYLFCILCFVFHICDPTIDVTLCNNKIPTDRFTLKWAHKQQP